MYRETFTPNMQKDREERLPFNVPGDAEYFTIKIDGQVLSVDVNKLIHLTENHPVEKVPLAEYITKIEQDCWGDSEGNKITPREVIDAIKMHGFDEAIKIYPNFSYHIERIRDVDYSYPLHAYEGKIKNGAHRLSKLVLAIEQGQSNQDFITIKNLSFIPKQTLVDSSMLE